VTYELFDKKAVAKTFQAYNTAEYMKLTHTKVNVLRYSLTKYPLIHFIDCDVICNIEPSPEFYAQYSDYDVVFQYDAGYQGDKKTLGDLYGAWTCTGNMTLRNGPGTQKFLDILTSHQLHYPNKNDQECIYTYFTLTNIHDVRKTTEFKCTVYPYELFVNGFLIKNKLVDPTKGYFIHANHVNGSQAKIDILKSIGHWNL
jgi:hypothetical protein